MSQRDTWADAEEHALRQFGAERANTERGDDAGLWYDGMDPQTEVKYQVKSAEEGRRFRLWENQHRSMTTSAGQLGEAYYLFVVEGRPVLRVDARKVTQWVNERGGWNQAGHKGRPNDRQLKIPEKWVYEQVDQ